MSIENQEHKLKQFAVLMRLIQRGAYDERQSDGTYGEDGIEEAADNLEAEGWDNGFNYCSHPDGSYSLEAMTEVELASYQAAKNLPIEEVTID